MNILANKNRKGFTLVELLVVIAIIGLLAAFIYTNVTGAMAKGRDARRKSDLSEMQKAVELYYVDNGKYPNTNGQWWGVCVNGGNHDISGANAYIPGLTPKYMRELPVDPLDFRTDWSGYLYRSDGLNYKILSHQTGPESFPLISQSFYDPVRPTWAWMVCSKEPACNEW